MVLFRFCICTIEEFGKDSSKNRGRYILQSLVVGLQFQIFQMDFPLIFTINFLFLMKMVHLQTPFERKWEQKNRNSSNRSAVNEIQTNKQTTKIIYILDWNLINIVNMLYIQYISRYGYGSYEPASILIEILNF